MKLLFMNTQLLAPSTHPPVRKIRKEMTKLITKFSQVPPAISNGPKPAEGEKDTPKTSSRDDTRNFHRNNIIQLFGCKSTSQLPKSSSPHSLSASTSVATVSDSYPL